MWGSIQTLQKYRELPFRLGIKGKVIGIVETPGSVHFTFKRPLLHRLFKGEKHRKHVLRQFEHVFENMGTVGILHFVEVI